MLSWALIALSVSTTIFALMWVVCVRVRNYGFLDVTWTYSVGLLALLAGLGGMAPRDRLFVPLLGVLWSLRLGTFVLLRVLRHHPQEDRRYQTLRARWSTPLAFLLFFEIQALVAVIFAVPFGFAARATAPAGPLQWVGLLIAALSIFGEALADAQATAFKRGATSHKVLDRGLWRYSRHPNYFFELLFWVGVAASVLDLPWGWTGLACPLLIGYFLLRVTGIPLTEKHSLEKHGEVYRDYQRRTSAFVPWFPKTTAHA